VAQGSAGEGEAAHGLEELGQGDTRTRGGERLLAACRQRKGQQHQVSRLQAGDGALDHSGGQPLALRFVWWGLAVVQRGHHVVQLGSCHRQQAGGQQFRLRGQAGSSEARDLLHGVGSGGGEVAGATGGSSVVGRGLGGWGSRAGRRLAATVLAVALVAVTLAVSVASRHGSFLFFLP
jgi:hypothetical protein